MPVDIKKMVIKATIRKDKPQKGAGKAGQIGLEQKQEIIQECIEQVMQILDRKKQR